MGPGQSIAKSDNVRKEMTGCLGHNCNRTDNYSLGIRGGPPETPALTHKVIALAPD